MVRLFIPHYQQPFSEFGCWYYAAKMIKNYHKGRGEDIMDYLHYISKYVNHNANSQEYSSNEVRQALTGMDFARVPLEAYGPLNRGAAALESALNKGGPLWFQDLSEGTMKGLKVDHASVVVGVEGDIVKYEDPAAVTDNDTFTHTKSMPIHLFEFMMGYGTKYQSMVDVHLWYYAGRSRLPKHAGF